MTEKQVGFAVFILGQYVECWGKIITYLLDCYILYCSKC